MKFYWNWYFLYWFQFLKITYFSLDFAKHLNIFLLIYFLLLWFHLKVFNFLRNGLIEHDLFKQDPYLNVEILVLKVINIISLNFNQHFDKFFEWVFLWRNLMSVICPYHHEFFISAEAKWLIRIDILKVIWLTVQFDQVLPLLFIKIAKIKIIFTLFFAFFYSAILLKLNSNSF